MLQRNYPLGARQMRILRILGSMPEPISTTKLRDLLHWEDKQTWEREWGINLELKQKRIFQRKQVFKSMRGLLERELVTKTYEHYQGHVSAIWSLTQLGREKFKSLNIEIMDG